MAISISDNHIVITSNYSLLGYEEIRARITSLLSLLSSVTDQDRLSTEDIYYVCNMIEDMLPSSEDFNALQRLHEGK